MKSVAIQLCAIILLFVFILLSLRRKQIRLMTKRWYFICLGATFICLIMEIVKIIYIQNSDLSDPSFSLRLVCKFYLDSVIITSCSMVVYVLSNVFSGRQFKCVVLSMVLFCLFSSTIIFLTPANFTTLDGENLGYLSGISVYLTYTFGLIIVAVIIAFCLFLRKKIGAKKCDATIFWSITILVFAIGTLILNTHKIEIQFVGFGFALAMAIIYAKLENPEAIIDSNTGYFNMNAFDSFTSELKKRNKVFSVIMISNLGKMGNRRKITQEFLPKFKKIMTTDKNVTLFTTLDKEILVLYRNTTDVKKYVPFIRELFYETFNGKLEVHINSDICEKYTILSNQKVIEQTYIISRLLNYVWRLSGINYSEDVVEIDEEIFESYVSDTDVIAKMIRGFYNDSYEVFYQPIYNCEKEKFTSCEALARLRDGDHYISPAKFIPVAERLGYISNLGKLIFEQTCIFISSNDFNKLGIETVDINVSCKQMEERGLASLFISIMRRYSINPSCINLEITETSSIKDVEQFKKNMESLIEFGVSFSLDDFGKGESNLSYLADYPFTTIKFDSAVVKSYFNNEKGRLVLKAAILMSNEMEINMVAEGVETSEELEEIENLGVQYIQGFYFSKPIPEKDFIEFIKESNLTKNS